MMNGKFDQPQDIERVFKKKKKQIFSFPPLHQQHRACALTFDLELENSLMVIKREREKRMNIWTTKQKKMFIKLVSEKIKKSES